jgi:hypothetical protein
MTITAAPPPSDARLATFYGSTGYAGLSSNQPPREETPLMEASSYTTINNKPPAEQRDELPFFQKASQFWIPSELEPLPARETEAWLLDTGRNSRGGQNVTFRRQDRIRRSWRRRLFLVLTEPDTSIASASFFFVLILAISLSNIIGIMQTMDAWQFIPTDCITCGG